MIEQEVEAEFLTADFQRILAADKGETNAELQQSSHSE